MAKSLKKLIKPVEISLLRDQIIAECVTPEKIRKAFGILEQLMESPEDTVRLRAAVAYVNQSLAWIESEDFVTRQVEPQVASSTVNVNVGDISNNKAAEELMNIMHERSRLAVAAHETQKLQILSPDSPELCGAG